MSKLFASIAASALILAATAIVPLAQSKAPKPTDGVALGGYCPMAYVEMNQAVKGDPQHKSEHQGAPAPVPSGPSRGWSRERAQVCEQMRIDEE